MLDEIKDKVLMKYEQKVGRAKCFWEQVFTLFEEYCRVSVDREDDVAKSNSLFLIQRDKRFEISSSVFENFDNGDEQEVHDEKWCDFKSKLEERFAEINVIVREIDSWRGYTLECICFHVEYLEKTVEVSLTASMQEANEVNCFLADVVARKMNLDVSKIQIRENKKEQEVSITFYL